MIASIVFFGSFAGIILMIVLKARRLKLEVRSKFSFISAKVDAKIRRAFAATGRFFSYFNRKSAVALGHLIAYHVFAAGHALYRWTHKKLHAHPHSKRMINMVQGKGEVEKGGASFYLKRISKEGTVGAEK